MSERTKMAQSRLDQKGGWVYPAALLYLCYAIYAAFPLFCQQRLDNLFRLGHAPFADLEVADVALLVDHVHGWPVAIAVRAPGFPVIIDGNGVRDIQVDGGLFHVVDISFEVEFGRVNADDG